MKIMMKKKFAFYITNHDTINVNYRKKKAGAFLLVNKKQM
jgi:hypothetical protein